MAFRLLRACNSLIKPITQSLLLSNSTVINVNNESAKIFKYNIPMIYSSRQTSFFTKNTAETLWKSVTSVSNAGRNRGRGRGKPIMKNLNRGQRIGIGKINMMWPGLTGPVMRGNIVVKQQKLPEDPERESRLIKLRDLAIKRKSRKVHPLERGWTSAQLGGKSIGPPDPVGEETFNGFDTKVLEHKIVNHMTGNLGRKRSFSTFVITGNGNGLCGIALGKSAEVKAAIRLAKNRAGSKLMYVPRYNNHTVFHDFFCEFGKTRIFVTKKPEGYGLICHRAIKCACEVIGIKDIYAKIEGSTNTQNVIKAFLIGLLQQKNHQQLADEKKLHLVEFRKENLMYPKVVASPTTVRKANEIPSTEVLDFNQYVYGGKMVLKKKKLAPFYTKFKSYDITRKHQEYLRNQDEVRIRMYADYNELRSFLTDKYPEAKPQLWKKKKPGEEEEVIE